MPASSVGAPHTQSRRAVPWCPSLTPSNWEWPITHRTWRLRTRMMACVRRSSRGKPLGGMPIAREQTSGDWSPREHGEKLGKRVFASCGERPSALPASLIATAFPESGPARHSSALGNGRYGEGARGRGSVTGLQMIGEPYSARVGNDKFLEKVILCNSNRRILS